MRARRHIRTRRDVRESARVTHDLVVARYNDLDDVDAKLALAGSRLAAILVEPVVGNMGLVVPDTDFSRGCRPRARGRRVADLRRGDHLVAARSRRAQARVGISPTHDGRQDSRWRVSARGVRRPHRRDGGARARRSVLHRGHACGQSLLGCDGLRVLDWLEQHTGVYAAMDVRAKRLAAGIRGVVARAGCDIAVVQLESIVDFKFAAAAPTATTTTRARQTGHVRRVLSRDARSGHLVAALAKTK